MKPIETVLVPPPGTPPAPRPASHDPAKLEPVHESTPTRFIDVKHADGTVVRVRYER